MSTIAKIVEKFEQTKSVEDVLFAIVWPSTSTRRRAQQLHLSRSSLMNIMHKDLHLHAYKVQLAQELKPLDHSKRREWAEWWQEMATVDD